MRPLQIEPIKSKINCVQLAVFLKEAYSSVEPSQSLNNEVAQGKFLALFVIQVCEVIGCIGFAFKH